MGLEQTRLGELERLVKERTHDRINNLRLEVTEGRIVLNGSVRSYHLKQLAQHGILDVLPKARVRNALVVRN